MPESQYVINIKVVQKLKQTWYFRLIEDCVRDLCLNNDHIHVVSIKTP